MDSHKISYTKFRMTLANCLKDVIAQNGVLTILWRGYEPCVVITKKQYQEFMKLRDIKIHTSDTDKTNKSVQEMKSKSLSPLMYKSQLDLFQ